MKWSIMTTSCVSFVSCRRKAFQLQLGRLRQEVCPLGRTVPPPPNSHGGEEVRLPRVRAPLYAQRPPDEAHPPPHDHEEGAQLADRGWQTEQNRHGGETQKQQQQQRSRYAHPRAASCLPGLGWERASSSSFLKIGKGSAGCERTDNATLLPQRVCAHFSFLLFRSSVINAM